MFPRPWPVCGHQPTVPADRSDMSKFSPDHSDELWRGPYAPLNRGREKHHGRRAPSRGREICGSAVVARGAGSSTRGGVPGGGGADAGVRGGGESGGDGFVV